MRRKYQRGKPNLCFSVRVCFDMVEIVALALALSFSLWGNGRRVQGW